MPTEPKKPLIVISYAHADEPEKPTEGEVKWLSFVTGYLRPALKQGAVDIWVDRLMRGGEDWEREIGEKLCLCDIFILLVSRNSLSSDYVVDKEIAIIRDRQAKGDGVQFYPLLLTPTPKIALDLVRDKNLRPRDAKPLSEYSLNDRYQHMSEAADEIAEIATAIAMNRNLDKHFVKAVQSPQNSKLPNHDIALELKPAVTRGSEIPEPFGSSSHGFGRFQLKNASYLKQYTPPVRLLDHFRFRWVIPGVATVGLSLFVFYQVFSVISDGSPAGDSEDQVERNVTRAQLKLIQGNSCIRPTGDFGHDNSETRQAIKDYQEIHGGAITGQLSKDDFFSLLSSPSCDQIGLHQSNSFERFFYEAAPNIEQLRRQLIAVVEALRPPDDQLLKIVHTNGFLDRVAFDDQMRLVIKGLQLHYGFPDTGKMTREFHSKIENSKVALVPPANPPNLDIRAAGGPIAWGKKVSDEFLAKVKDICIELICDPGQLMAIMAYETRETFSPSVVNPVSGAVGLLQFIAPTAKALGTSTDELGKMDAIKQLNSVQRYLQPFRGRIANLEDLVAALEYPAAVGAPSGYAIPFAAYVAIRGDPARSGVVTKRDLASKIQEIYEKGLRPENAVASPH